MPKSKNRKDHKKRVAARNTQIQAQKKAVKKKLLETLEQLKQQEAGGYYANPGVSLPTASDDSEGFQIIQ